MVGSRPLAIGLVFLTAGLSRSCVNPVLGRYSDRVGRLSRSASHSARPWSCPSCSRSPTHGPRSLCSVCAAAIALGGFYTPGMALVSDRAEAAGLAQALAFGVMNTAWALGNVTGPAVGGALAERFGDAVPYALGRPPLPVDPAGRERVASAAARAWRVQRHEARGLEPQATRAAACCGAPRPTVSSSPR